MDWQLLREAVERYRLEMQYDKAISGADNVSPLVTARAEIYDRLGVLLKQIDKTIILLQSRKDRDNAPKASC